MEPQYNAELLTSDHAYQYAMVDEFIAYFDSITDFRQKASYFYRMAEAMNKAPGWGSQLQVNMPLEVEGYAPKVWQINYSSQQEKSIIREQRFLAYKQMSHFTAISNQPIVSYEDRIRLHKEGLDGAQNRKEYLRSQVCNIDIEIAKRLEMTNRWIDRKKRQHDPYFPEEVLIEYTDIVNAIKIHLSIHNQCIINWSVFFRREQFMPFIELWDAIKFQLFLADPSEEAPNKSMKCKMSEDQLDLMFSLCLDSKLFAAKTNKDDFVAAFKGTEQAEQPVESLMSNRALAYLFVTMHERELIDQKDWQSVIEKRKLFKNKNGKFLIASDLSSAVNKYLKEGNPSEQPIIDDILIAVKAKMR